MARVGAILLLGPELLDTARADRGQPFICRRGVETLRERLRVRERVRSR